MGGEKALEEPLEGSRLPGCSLPNTSSDHLLSPKVGVSCRRQGKTLSACSRDKALSPWWPRKIIAPLYN